jgi:hypothetical protein
MGVDTEFLATSCSLTDRFEIGGRFSTSEDTPEIETDQVIRMTLQPGTWRNGKLLKNVTFSMFGTKRTIRHFTLEISPLADPEKEERCAALGSVSNTYEIDFRKETSDDCLWFYLYVKPETFARYVALIDQGAIDTVFFSIGSVDGFYSDWSPSISTNRVKVLLTGEEHKIDLPPSFQGELRRLGRVRDARLQLHRALKLEKDTDTPSTPAIEDEAEPTPPPANPPLQVTSEMDPRLLPALASLKQAAWVAVALLAAIVAMVFLKH